MIKQLRPAIVSLALFTLLTGAIYPLFVTAVAQVVFPHQARGSMIVQSGKVVGSALIGQHFDAPGYFWGRPSATGSFPYNGSASAGSNLGPLNPALDRVVRERIAALQQADPGNNAPIPADLVTASASGLDPHISLAAALYQAPRVARARSLDEAEVSQLINQHTEGRQLGVLGEARVNVLKLNLGMDSFSAR